MGGQRHHEKTGLRSEHFLKRRGSGILKEDRNATAIPCGGCEKVDVAGPLLLSKKRESQT